LAESEDDAKRMMASGKPIKRSRSKRPTKRANQWDSPLLLIGGGALALLCLCGVAVFYFLFRESGDEVLNEAKAAMEGGSYNQAISHYQAFVNDYPRHPDHDEARIKLAVARLWYATESQNYPVALKTAQDEIAAIEKNEKFSLVQGELAELLPRIATGLALAAEKETEPEKVTQLTAQAAEALKLCSNTSYIPRSMRGPEIEEVQATLDRIARRQKASADLTATIATMEAANAAGDTRAAYAAYETLRKSSPELMGNEQLLATVAKTSNAEKASIAFVEEPLGSLNSEPQSPVIAELALADRRTTATAPATGVAAIQVNGALYGVDIASGRLLWRRYIGVSQNRMLPVSAGGDILFLDAISLELLRLRQPSGELVWRVPVGEQIAQPVVVGDRIFLAGESGKLHVLEFESGNRLGHVTFAQPLRVPPVADPSGELLYVVGDHSSIYTLSIDDLACRGVFYLGHDRGTVVASPAVVLNKLAVTVNDGVESSRLQLFELDADGIIAKQLVEQRLSGLVTQQPLVDGRRLIVATDRGQVSVYDVSSAADASSMNLIAGRSATRSEPLASVVAVAAGHIWIADNQLAKYSIDPTNTRITVREIADNYTGATFHGVPLVFGDVLVLASTRRGQSGATLTAIAGKSGESLWETDVALRPAGAPAPVSNPRGLLMGSAAGKVFLLDRAAIAARVQDTPLPSAARPSTAKPLQFRHELPDGGMVFSAKSSADVLLYNPTAPAQPPKWVHLPSPLSCEPAVFGGGWIAPTEIGQVLLLDGAGRSLAAPFQPALKPGVTKHWLPASVVGEKQFVITDGVEAIHLVEQRPTPQPHLAVVKDTALGPTRASTRTVFAGGRVIAGASEPRLVTFTIPGLAVDDPIALTAEVVWGPFAVGDHVLVATAAGKLVCVAATDGTTAWQQDQELNPVGAPLVRGDAVLLSLPSGVLQKRLLASGEESARLELKQPLAAGPVEFEQRLAVATDDGAILIVNAP
jgi:outer membrane protein assembly factor BamB